MKYEDVTNGLTPKKFLELPEDEKVKVAQEVMKRLGEFAIQEHDNAEMWKAGVASAEEVIVELLNVIAKSPVGPEDQGSIDAASAWLTMTSMAMALDAIENDEDITGTASSGALN